jgi:hypothetical protein
MKAFVFTATLAVLAAGALPASADDDISKQIISIPAPAAFNVTGLQGAPDLHKDPQLQGGQFLRVSVPKKGANPWDISVGVPINKPIKAGDHLVLAFWARLAQGENGATTTTLPYNAVQQSGPPYTPIFFGSVEITKDWQIYQAGDGVAGRAYKVGEATVSIQLATAKQVVDIGPVFVLDTGPAGGGQ